MRGDKQIQMNSETRPYSFSIESSDSGAWCKASIYRNLSHLKSPINNVVFSCHIKDTFVLQNWKKDSNLTTKS